MQSALRPISTRSKPSYSLIAMRSVLPKAGPQCLNLSTSRCHHVCAAAPSPPTSTIKKIQHDIRSKERSAVEVVQHYLDNIQRTDASVGSFITVDGERALEQACKDGPSSTPLGVQVCAHCTHVLMSPCVAAGQGPGRPHSQSRDIRIGAAGRCPDSHQGEAPKQHNTHSHVHTIIRHAV